MLAPPHRHKRPRSPTPPLSPSHASPLDTYLKRRKRDELTDTFWSEPEQSPIPHNPPAPVYDRFSDPLDGDPWVRQAGVEHRRTRQWERLNAPQSERMFSSSSQPNPSSSTSSPAPRWTSQPDASSHHRRGEMSSSPIRHILPSSSPFRSSQTRAEDWIDPEEMRREWGEEYAAQNSVLHNLVQRLTCPRK